MPMAMTARRAARTAMPRISVLRLRSLLAGDQLAWKRALGLRPDRVRMRGGVMLRLVEACVARPKFCPFTTAGRPTWVRERQARGPSGHANAGVRRASPSFGDGRPEG